jgi:tRNA pseudouridine13 synthase
VHEAEEDDRRPGRLKVRLSFSLPPGAYATLVLLRLFGTSGREADPRTQREQTRRREKKQKKRERREASKGKPRDRRRA